MNFDKYKNKLEYPRASTFSVTYFYKGGQVVNTLRNDVYDHDVNADDYATQETVTDNDALKTARKAYSEETAALMEQFKNDLFFDNSLQRNDFTEKLYAIAWDKGHSNGLSEVASEFEDLVVLVDLAKSVYS